MVPSARIGDPIRPSIEDGDSLLENCTEGIHNVEFRSRCRSVVRQNCSKSWTAGVRGRGALALLSATQCCLICLSEEYDMASGVDAATFIVI